ncbi:MAG: murein biosynthesis integral membrane protein MurJ [Candidatus Pacebacteria bacterium]|jgi:putative peptidoglycan lipid II flippase|nr:murein biosynthesis integral membrane protein MurJ [Candidatus Paceibacterota bacterium]
MRKIFTKSVFNHQSETILGAALLTAFFSLLSSLLGVLRNALLASRFGASANLDIYYASFRLPDFIYNIFIAGALTVVFLPIFTDCWRKNKEDAWKFTNASIMIIGIIIILLAGLIVVFARPILTKILVGFTEEKLNQAIVLTRIMMLQPLLLGISAIVSSVLRFFKLFLVTAIAPLMYNLGIIAGLLFFTPIFGLKGLAYGVVLGALLHLVIQLPSLFNAGYHLQFNIKVLKEMREEIKRVIIMTGPRLIGVMSYQVFLLAVTAIATLLQEGSLTIFNFANDFQNLPLNVFALSFSIAAFPRLAQLESSQLKEEFNKVFSDTSSQILFFLVPLATWIIIFREPIVRLLLGYGRFNWQATLTTTKVLAILTLSLIFNGLNQLFLKTFFAKKDVLTPIYAALIAYILGLGITYYGSLKLGIWGLAIGVTLANILDSVLMSYFLKKKFGLSLSGATNKAVISEEAQGVHDKIHIFKRFQLKTDESRVNFIKKMFWLFLISIISGGLGYGIFKSVTKVLPSTKVINLVIASALGGGLTVMIFIIGVWLSGMEEIRYLRDFFKRDVFKIFKRHDKFDDVSINI